MKNYFLLPFTYKKRAISHAWSAHLRPKAEVNIWLLSYNTSFGGDVFLILFNVVPSVIPKQKWNQYDRYYLFSHK